MKTERVTIANRAGLHARAATKLSKLAASFSSEIKVGHDKMVDGKSILSLMMLAAVKGTELKIVAEGRDEEEAVAAMVELIENKFDEPV